MMQNLGPYFGPGRVPRVRLREPPYVSVMTYRETPGMSTTRRPLGNGPTNTRTTPTEERAPRLLPVELADVDEHQEHDEPRTRPAPGRWRLGGRGRRMIRTLSGPETSDVHSP